MRRKRKPPIFITSGLFLTLSVLAIGFLIFQPEFLSGGENTPSPREKLIRYMSLINERNFDEMYDSLSQLSQANISREDFIEKNSNIYNGIVAKNLSVEILGETQGENNQITIEYDCSMETLAGKLSFTNKAHFVKNGSPKKDSELYLLWSTQLILPLLQEGDKVRVNTIPAERGDIFDRNGFMLAGESIAYSVGFVPDKMGPNKESDMARAAQLLEVTYESVQRKLTASYVRPDMFVEIKTIPANEPELERALLEIKGIKITNTQMRHYPLGEKASHLTGYIQNVNAEDLENLEGQGYGTGSVIGRSGLEKIYEDRLRGRDGYEIVITDSENIQKASLAKMDKKNGENIYIAIDAWLQNILYEQFWEDKSCSVVMNSKTGEILALVSTPSFDANDFVLGMSQEKWDSLNSDEEGKPLYNRFKAALVPGSCFKAIIGAIGITTGALDPYENFGESGLSWQKDGSWGGYLVNTMSTYPEAANLENALVYSDNIYFAKAALNIGEQLLAESLFKIGFDETIPFEIGLFSSSFSATNKFENEIQLADSGYGQGQVILNPVHMASIYSAFVNKGSMLKPRLIYDGNIEFWKENAFSEKASQIIYEDLREVVSRGSGRSASVEGLNMAGKTGTAEVKLSKEDEDGTELGWFSLLVSGGNIEEPLIFITMVEDVKERGGSRYVTEGIKSVLEIYNALP